MMPSWLSGEAVLGVALYAGLANTWFHLLYHRSPLYLDPLSLVGRDPRARPSAAQWGTLLVALGGVFGFAAGLAPQTGAVAALTAIYGLRRWEVATYPGGMVARLGKYAPASAALLAWLVAGALNPAHAWDAAAGVFAACYVLAGIAKVRETGWGWGRAENMSLLLAERGFGRFGALRLRLATNRAACAAIGAAGLGVEFAAAGFLWAPARPGLAVGIVAFKALTYVLYGYFEPEWALTAAAIGVAAYLTP
ncbi:hypothetical protein LBMAG42_23600 [Deltaproteobacteria bacterium]|nr:hypothetical protein LBMAG42_23600 [Deltaproteobacteria bacterium]